jgi:DNA polymerase III delta prime subunit
MVGQYKLKNKINNLTIDSCPRTILLSGEYGSGKHVILEELRTKLNLESINITENLNYEYLESIKLTVEPRLYFIDGDKLTVKQQNVILKFLEEPTKSIFIVILMQDKNLLLSTVLNRCSIWNLEKYSKEELKDFISNEKYEYLLNIFNTPGQLIEAQKLDIDLVMDLANKLINKGEVANLANMFKVSTYLSFKDKEPGIDVVIFTYFLKYFAYLGVINNTPHCYIKYKITNQLYKDIRIHSLDRKQLFDNYLCSLKGVVSNRASGT